MKVTLFLRHEHETLQSLLSKLGKTGIGSQSGKKLFEQIQREIQMHSQVSSEIFYSALAATPSDRAVELVSTAEKRHQAMEKLLQELNGMNLSDHNFAVKMGSLIAEFERHIEMEEEELFHEARKNFPEYRLEELGLEMQDRRNSLESLAAA